MPRIHLASAAIVLAAFVSGLAAGAGLHAAWRPDGPPGPPHGPPPRGLPPYLRELGLTPEQEVQARAIFERHRADLDDVMRESLPRVRAVNDRVEQELAAVLTPTQRERLAALRRERRGPGRPGDPLPGPGLGPPPGEEGPFGGPPPPPPGGVVAPPGGSMPSSAERSAPSREPSTPPHAPEDAGP